jgi:hypothetical protein
MSYSKPAFEVANIVREHGKELIAKGKLTSGQKKVMTAIGNCRTSILGGHQEKCSNHACSFERYAYNGCRDRHCPKCNGLKREKWVAQRKADALPVPYFHVVFTIPSSLETLSLSHAVIIYNLLFKSAWDTLCFFASNHNHLGANMGMVAILHTWGQNLMRHTHIHCLVPAGGIDRQGKWRNSKKEGKFFVHVKKLSRVFRGKFTDGLIDLQNQKMIQLDQELIPKLKYLHPLYRKQWVVYAKKPFPSSHKVVEYIGRYSHRVAISNHRIKQFQDGVVTFSWIDYRTSKEGLLHLHATDFLQRFFSHVLPIGFMKIRHYGILSSRNKAENIRMVRGQFNVPALSVPVKGLNWIQTFELLYGRHPKLCPCCGIGILVAVATLLPNHLIKTRSDPDILPNTDFCNQQ